MPKFKKRQFFVDAVQVTKEMFDTKQFPPGVLVRQVPWQGEYARELELKHGPLEVPFLVRRIGDVRVRVYDWIVTDGVGERHCVHDAEFQSLFEPA